MNEKDAGAMQPGEAEYVARREAVAMTFVRAALMQLDGSVVSTVSKSELYYIAVNKMNRAEGTWPIVADQARVRDAVAVVYREWKRALPLARQWGALAERKKAALRRAQQDEQPLQERAS